MFPGNNSFTVEFVFVNYLIFRVLCNEHEIRMRNQLAEKMAGEITLSDSPGHALKKWRMNFEVAPGILADRLGVSPSVISDYESGRRKSPGTAVFGKIVDTLLDMDEK